MKLWLIDKLWKDTDDFKRVFFDDVTFVRSITLGGI